MLDIVADILFCSEIRECDMVPRRIAKLGQPADTLRKRNNK